MSARLTHTAVYEGDLGKIVKVVAPGWIDFDAYDRTGIYVNSYRDIPSAKRALEALEMEQSS